MSEPVPADDAAFAARKGRLRLALRVARRALALHASGQTPRLRPRLSREWRRLLWVHEGMPQIGDALMDSAPRSLLVEEGFRVDLFAPPHIASLFDGDAWFGRVLSRPDDVHAADYDAVIVLSHDHKALRLKRARLAALPWVSLQGFYGGPDFHRARFATRRLADLLGIALDGDAFARHSAQKLSPGDGPIIGPVSGPPFESTQPSGCIALALGGVRAERTYGRWPELVAALQAHGLRRFVLVGSANGRDMADRLVAAFGDGLDLHDFVGRTGLRETRRLLARSAAIVCADGGLMHLAFTTRVPVVALFGAAIDPAWRVPIGFDGIALRSSIREVDGLGAERVAEAVREVVDASSSSAGRGAERP